MVNFGVVGNIVGILVLLLGGLMLTSLGFSLYYASGDALAIAHGNTSRIIAAIFQPPKAIDHPLRNALSAVDANDAAHSVCLSSVLS